MILLRKFQANNNVNISVHKLSKILYRSLQQKQEVLFGDFLRPNPKKNMVIWDPRQKLTIASPYVHSRVDTNTFTMGNQPCARVDLNPMSELTLSPSQGLCIWTLVSWASLSEHCDKVYSHFLQIFSFHQYRLIRNDIDV